MNIQQILRFALIFMASLITGCATTTAYDRAKDLEKAGRYGDAGDVWLDKAKSALSSKYDYERFPSWEFELAAANFDRDPKRENDATRARKAAADMYLKQAAFYAAQGKFDAAYSLAFQGARIYKHYDPKQKDLGDIPSAEGAYLLSTGYADAGIRSGEMSLDQGLSSMASNYKHLSDLIKGQDPTKAKRYAGEILTLASRGTPPLGSFGSQLVVAAHTLDGLGDQQAALSAHEKALEYAQITHNVANFERAIVVADKLGRLDLARKWRKELKAIEKVEGRTDPGLNWIILYDGKVHNKSPDEIDREGERRRTQAEAYRAMGESRLANLRQAMATSLFAQGRSNRQEAARKAREDAQLAEQQRRDAIEEQARREKSARDFANAVGAATAMMKGAKSTGAAPAYSQNSQTQSQGGCKKVKGDPSCYVGACNKAGGKAIVKRDNLGCGKVYCTFADSQKNYSDVYDYLPGSGCAGAIK